MCRSFGGLVFLFNFALFLKDKYVLRHRRLPWLQNERRERENW